MNVKRKPRASLWYAARVCDRHRWRREMRDFVYGKCPQFRPLYEEMYRGDDSARLALADAAEENGYPYLSMFLRTLLVCASRSPLERKRRK